ncbi:MAG: hypothetical protein IT275_06370 [Chitinophagales bacterium]|nr:hypothetical protein [Chitinophagales bacterium]
MKKILLFTVASFFLGNIAMAQNNVGIGTNLPDPSAKLDVKATDKGLLIPNVSLTARNVAAPITSPAISLLVYNTNTSGAAPNNVYPGYYYWSGTEWIRMVASVKAQNGTNISTTGPNASASDPYVELGGALVRPTTVSALTATNKMSFTGTGVDAFNVDGTTFSVDATNDMVGIEDNTPSEKLQVAGNILADQNVIATQGIVTGKLNFKRGPATSSDNTWHKVELDAGYGATMVSAYATGSMDGEMKIQGVDISNLLSASSTWYRPTTYGIGATQTTSSPGSGTTGTNVAPRYNFTNNQHYHAICPDGTIATGWQAYATGYLDDGLAIKCTTLSSGYTTVESGNGVESLLNHPDCDENDMTHFGVCPTGTYVKSISVYNDNYLDRQLRAYCTGIKRQ